MKSLTMDQAQKTLEEILELLRTPDSVVRFHALPVQEHTKMTPWRFQIPMQSDAMTMLLRKLEMNSLWTLVDAQFKRHSPQASGLTQRLAQAANVSMGKGKGKGKNKSKTPNKVATT